MAADRTKTTDDSRLSSSPDSDKFDHISREETAKSNVDTNSGDDGANVRGSPDSDKFDHISREETAKSDVDTNPGDDGANVKGIDSVTSEAKSRQENLEIEEPITNANVFKAPSPSNFVVPLAASSKSSTSSRSLTGPKVKGLCKLTKDDSKSWSNTNSSLQVSNILPEKSDVSSQFQQPHPSPDVYKEPQWGGETLDEYSFEVLKNGTIIGNVPLKGKSFFVFGRLPSCDVTLEHPSLSRYHAVIQHAKESSNVCEKGWYIYDLESTHGTWLNKRKLQPKTYYRLRVGYVVKFGGSSRLHILQGPSEDADDESELSVSEMKQQREQLKKEAEVLHQNELLKIQQEQDAERKMLEDQGCSWGLGDDARDDGDENPFATLLPENESSYIDDPKKALKGFYEREGCDLPDYQFTEVSMGKHRCHLDLPVDGPNGEELVAEATVSGKKKDAVIACALEACRLLDRMGLFRPAQHESRKRKQKNWEADDYYDSDEDTFLDRTGTIEKKRFLRMKKAGKEEAETYDSLMEKYLKVTSQIAEIEAKLEKAKAEAEALAREEMDELDAYMFSIKSGAMDTKTRMSLKGELLHLRMDEQHLSKLLNIAKPASVPPLETQNSETAKNGQSFTSRLRRIQAQKKKDRKILSPKEVLSSDKPSNFEEEEEEDEENEDVRMLQEGETQREVKKDHPDDRTSHVPENTVNKRDSQETERKTLKSTSATRSSQSHPKKKGISSSSLSPISAVKGPDLPPPSSHISSEQSKKSCKFSTSQALDMLDRPPRTEQKSQLDKQYEEQDPDYATWLPPSEQSGDGRTSLNDKLGY